MSTQLLPGDASHALAESGSVQHVIVMRRVSRRENTVVAARSARHVGGGMRRKVGRVTRPEVPFELPRSSSPAATVRRARRQETSAAEKWHAAFHRRADDRAARAGNAAGVAGGAPP